MMLAMPSGTWEVPYLEVAVGSPLVRGDRSRIAIDPNPSPLRLDVLQVLVALESGDGRAPIQVYPAIG